MRHIAGQRYGSAGDTVVITVGDVLDAGVPGGVGSAAARRARLHSRRVVVASPPGRSPPGYAIPYAGPPQSSLPPLPAPCHRREHDNLAGMPDSRSGRSLLLRATPRRGPGRLAYRSKARAKQSVADMRVARRGPLSTLRPDHFHPGQIRNAHPETQSGGYSRAWLRTHGHARLQAGCC